MEEKTPTERVRTMLDERCVEHYDNDMNRDVRYTMWDNGGKREVRYEEWSNGTTRLDAGNVTPEQAIAATVGSGRVSVAKQMRTALESRRTCAECPEMDNPDSYISHLQSALKWHDEHVPRPTNPRNTCVVLMGQKPPEEVLFVREDGGGVTHYLPEDAGTCDGSFHKSSDLSSGRVMLYYCKDTNRSIFVEREAKFCPNCGAGIWR